MLKHVLSKFEEFCTPKKNLTFERHNLFSYQQKQGETIDQIITELRSKLRSCELAPLENSLLLTQLVRGISDNCVRAKLLRVCDLESVDLDKAVQICKASEIVKSQAEELNIVPDGASVNTVKKCMTLLSPKQQHARQRHALQQDGAAGGRQDEYSCSRCGRVHAPRRCPAYNKTCIKCQRR